MLVALAALALLPTPPLEAQSSDESQRKALKALGYIAHPTETKATPTWGKSGLVRWTPDRVTPGFTLITVIPESLAILVDRKGTTVSSWRTDDSRRWGRAILLRGGDVLVQGSLEKDTEKESRVTRGDGPSPPIDPMDGSRWLPRRASYLARYSASGSLVWRRSSFSHHDLEVDPQGKILTLGLGDREVAGLPIQDNTIKVLSATGETEKFWSLLDLLSSKPDVFELPLTTSFPRAKNSNGRLDLLHANAAKRMPFPALASRGRVYCATCVLITVRHQNLVAIIDLEAAELLWVWGPGALQYPHEGQWLDNGNVLIFDNGSEERGYSRVVEVRPTFDSNGSLPTTAAGEIVWSYEAKSPKDFFTRARGTAQPLENGNVLIASSQQGRVFEITRRGEIVWEYIVRNQEGKLTSIRAAKYPRSMFRSRRD